MQHLLFVLTILALCTQALALDSVSVCGDGEAWPPFHFFDPQGTPKGFDLDVLKYALDKQGIKLHFSMPPWRRCLYSVASGEFQIAVSAAYSQERDDTYLLTQDYYRITPAVVARKSDVIDKRGYRFDELSKMKLCGLKGYFYSYLGDLENQVIAVDDNYQDAFNIIGSRSCDVVAVRKEILLGHEKLLGRSYTGDDYVILPILDAEPEKFYMLISKNFKQGPALKALMDDAITELKASNRLDAMLNVYLQP